MLVNWMIIMSPPNVDWSLTLDKTFATLRI